MPMTLISSASADDPLARVVKRIRPVLANSTDSHQRIRALWAAAKFARNVASADAVAETFMWLAVDTGLIDRRGRWTSADIADHRRGYGREDVAHVISWALRGMNPFMTGPLYDDN